jgi:hypothetical protein
MDAIDRVMRAYSQTHTLTDAQFRQVRIELSAFIRELMLGKLPVVGAKSPADEGWLRVPERDA